jgi:hypothetical protein
VKYVLIMQVNPTVLDALTDEQKQAVGDGHGAFMAAITESGELISTFALGDPSLSAVVRAGKGQPVVSDGPFAEAKEFMGGLYLLDVESRERALELATRIPDAAIEGLAIEVRPVMFAAGPES